MYINRDGNRVEEITRKQASCLVRAFSAYDNDDVPGMLDMLTEADEASYIATKADSITWNGYTYELEIVGW